MVSEGVLTEFQRADNIHHASHILVCILLRIGIPIPRSIDGCVSSSCSLAHFLSSVLFNF